MATVKELRDMIETKTNEVNKMIADYRISGKENALVEKEIDYLRAVTNTADKALGVKPRNSRSRKAELLAQLYELEQASKLNELSASSLNVQKERDKRAYRSFKKNFKTNVDYETWRKLVTVYGAGGSRMLNLFGGSNETQNTIITATKKGKKTIDILQAMQDVTKDFKGKEKSTDDYYKELERRLGLRK